MQCGLRCYQFCKHLSQYCFLFYIYTHKTTVNCYPPPLLSLSSFILSLLPAPPTHRHGAGQLKVMFVGGPNQRKDYHIEEGEEVRRVACAKLRRKEL